MELVVAEKPKVAQKIAMAIGRNVQRKVHGNVAYYEGEHDGRAIVVAPAVGHVYTLVEKKKTRGYPVFDIEWAPAYKASRAAAYTKPYISLLEQLGKKADIFVSACDYDVEGSTIAYNVFRFATRIKEGRRMKFSALTSRDLVEAYEAMEGFDYNNAYAGEARHMLDWYYGINLSRALMASLRAASQHKIMSIGRVQGPALDILATLEKEIKAFVPVPYWVLTADVKNTQFAHKKGQFFEEAEADARLAKTADKGTVARVEKEGVKMWPWPCFDLTSLQVEAHRVFGFNPSKTLQLAQSLYEDSLITYPRTSSQKIPPSINLPVIVKRLAENGEYEAIANKIVENSWFRIFQGKKEDPAHPAIHPTGLRPEKLEKDEAKLYDLIVRRFLAAFAPPAEKENTRVEVDAGGEPYTASGSRLTEPGWTDFYGKYFRGGEKELPQFEQGESVALKKKAKTKKETQPPRRYSQASIVSELEKRKLGTKCLIGSTRVLCENNKLKRMDEIFEAGHGLEIEDDQTEIKKLNTPLTTSLERDKICYSAPSHASRRKLRKGEKLLTVETETAKITLTDRHPIYVYDDGIKVREARQLRKTDKIIAVTSNEKQGNVLLDLVFFNSSRFKVCKGKISAKSSAPHNAGILVSKLPVRWSKGLAWLLGYFYGDGSYSDPKYTGSHQVSFTTTETKALDLLKSNIKNIFGFEPYCYDLGGKYKVDCNGTMSYALANIFPEMRNKKIINRIPQEFVGDFLRGFFDADGNVHLRPTGKTVIKGKKTNSFGTPRIKLTLANRKLLGWMQRLLKELDIETTEIRKGKACIKEKKYECWTFRISKKFNVDAFAWKVGFDVPYKEAILYRGLWCDSPHYKIFKNCAKIVKLLNTGEADLKTITTRADLTRYAASQALCRLYDMDIITKKRTRKGDNWNYWSYGLRNVDYLKHAIKLSCEKIAKDIYAVPIEAINEKKYEDEYVYDLSVSPTTPNFVVDGFLLVHNSTRSVIVDTLFKRGYVTGKQLEVTDFGLKVRDVLKKYASEILDEDLTRRIEEDMEKIQDGKTDKDAVIAEGKEILIQILDKWKANEVRIGKDIAESLKLTESKENFVGKCDKCGGNLKIIRMKGGKQFIGCSSYPNCRNAYPLPGGAFVKTTEKLCPVCGKPVVFVARDRMRFEMCVDINCPSKDKWKKKGGKAQGESGVRNEKDS